MKEHHWQWIFEAINNIDGVQPVGLLLRKSTTGQLTSFRLRNVEIPYFHDQVKRKLGETREKLQNGDIRIIKDFVENIDESDISILDVDHYKSIKNTIQDILQTTSANEIDVLDTMEKVKTSVMLFEISNHKSIIALDRVLIVSDTFKKVKLVATYDNGLHQLNKPVLAFKIGMPCIYFQETNRLVVFNMKETEEIFNLLEHYRKSIIKKFNELADDGIIDMDLEIIKSQTESIGTARKTYNLIKGDIFTTDIEDYKKYKEYCIINNIDEDSVKLDIVDDKIVIKTKKQFDTFLNLAGYNFVESVIDKNKKFMAISKRKVETKTVSKVMH